MLHIIQNDPEVPPGNIEGNLTIPWQLHHPYRGGSLPEQETISALIVLGGAMGANDDHLHPFLVELKGLIRRVVAAGIPYLGICLGGQLLAAALGAKVSSGQWEEIGVRTVSLTVAGSSDPLFRGLSGDFATFQWHHDSFAIPAGGVLLATSAACPHQAFRVGSSAWGLQFHPEVTEGIIRDWCAWENRSPEQTAAVIAPFAVNAEQYGAIARLLLNNFLGAAGLV
jgi:GMP synthase-like glutamine amidotransferase